MGWEEVHRGRIRQAREAADDLLAVGRRLNDPRAIGLATRLLSWLALATDDVAAALNLAKSSIDLALTPFDRDPGILINAIALVMLRRPEGGAMLRDLMDQYAEKGWYWFQAGAFGFWGVALVLRGDIRAGIRWLEQCISAKDKEGYHTVASWN